LPSTVSGLGAYTQAAAHQMDILDQDWKCLVARHVRHGWRSCTPAVLRRSSGGETTPGLGYRSSTRRSLAERLTQMYMLSIVSNSSSPISASR
jgi:hypothetical protein